MLITISEIKDRKVHIFEVEVDLLLSPSKIKKSNLHAENKNA